MRSLAREFDLGGITFFGRLGNIETPEQVAGLAFDVRSLGRELPAWVGIDQEGGRVARLRSPFTEWPPMAVLGRSDDPALARKFAGALAAELAAVGISLDYAPVLDIHTNPKNPVIGDRALGEKPEIVAKLGRVIIEELQRAGVAACGKAFSRSRRHRHRFASRASDRRAPAGSIARHRIRAVQGGHRRERGVHHDGARARRRRSTTSGRRRCRRRSSSAFCARSSASTASSSRTISR